MSGKYLVTIGNRDGVACRRKVGSEVPLLVIHVFNLRAAEPRQRTWDDPTTQGTR